MNEETKNNFTEIIVTIAGVFIRPLFILIGLNILRKYGINIPMFSYWEVLLLRLALGNLYPNYNSKKSKRGE